MHQKVIGNYLIEVAESLEFKGPCCSNNGQFNSTNVIVGCTFMNACATEYSS